MIIKLTSDDISAALVNYIRGKLPTGSHIATNVKYIFDLETPEITAEITIKEYEIIKDKPE